MLIPFNPHFQFLWPCSSLSLTISFLEPSFVCNLEHLRLQGHQLWVRVRHSKLQAQHSTSKTDCVVKNGSSNSIYCART